MQEPTYLYIYAVRSSLKDSVSLLKYNGKKSDRVEQTFRSFRSQNMAGL